MAFDLICVRTQGASHIDDGLPCEDFGAVRKGAFYQVFALGDGHGDSNCPRSSLGSQWVCESALDALCSFAEDVRQDGSVPGAAADATDEAVEQEPAPAEEAPEPRRMRSKKMLLQDAVSIIGDEQGNADLTGREALLFDPQQAKMLMRQVAVSIVGDWTSRVNSHYAENPLTDEEWAGCSDRYKPRYQAGERIEHIYGTTLIAGLVTDTYALLLQQGDGRLCVFDAQGDVSQPIPWDDRCFANVTTSMCDEDALASMRFCIWDLRSHPVVAVLAGSDGVEDAYFSPEQMHSFYREQLVYAARSSVAELQTKLQAELPAFSAGGSRDDVTICGIIDAEAVRPFVERYDMENAQVPIQLELSRIEERLPKMQGKMGYLQGNVAKAEKDYRAAVAVRDPLAVRVQELRSDVSNVNSGAAEGFFSLRTLSALRGSLGQQQAKLEEDLKNAEADVVRTKDAYERACKELEDYVALRNGLIAERDGYKEQLKALGASDDSFDNVFDGGARSGETPETEPSVAPDPEPMPGFGPDVEAQPWTDVSVEPEFDDIGSRIHRLSRRFFNRG
ncbi:Uncharacterised protein [Slackia heliotrinireducens]|uniref:PPM-type phosphatase domain-containing protein n=1 Tax=Slackia heliotrinireducens (strain ATCC 29202 / DSM 20476 / NCTC 11029 / RHS 1) TaxID=471855 RepID=C7N2F9_SLAHD|nr:protein phosphatase 2C domain-containing protein [Slackia heliotrinireducens]ACV21465.1 hypothetical protein Shel_04040 [Slackia heliotrinireducens DSM 20476]VEG98904.1 Uncharacterised protein [Slackia heliotrinireducens]